MKELALKILQQETDGFEAQSRLRDDVIDAMIRFKNESEQLTIPDVVVSEERAELCDNPNCEDGIVDRDYYGHPIYCQVCESHN